MSDAQPHLVAIALFELVTESAAAIRSDPTQLEAPVESDTKILEFCEDFFQQFLKSVAGIVIGGFEPKDKEEVARARLGSKSAPARAVMAQCEKLCDFYFELLGSVQLPGAEKRFRVTYMTRLLTRIEAWAKSVNDDELVARATEASKDYAGAVSS